MDECILTTHNLNKLSLFYANFKFGCGSVEGSIILNFQPFLFIKLDRNSGFILFFKSFLLLGDFFGFFRPTIQNAISMLTFMIFLRLFRDSFGTLLKCFRDRDETDTEMRLRRGLRLRRCHLEPGPSTSVE